MSLMTENFRRMMIAQHQRHPRNTKGKCAAVKGIEQIVKINC